jgi:hypothetical protein
MLQIFHKIVRNLSAQAHKLKQYHAPVVKLVDIPDLGSGAARHGGSSPSRRTSIKNPYQLFGKDFFYGFIVLIKVRMHGVQSTPHPLSET